MGAKIRVKSKFQRFENAPQSNRVSNNRNISKSFNILDVDSSADNQTTKKKSQQKHRIIGTPDYIAPEILEGKGLNDPVIDWWSVGVILFEFLVGIPPFNADTRELVFENIKNLNIPWSDISIGDGEDSVSLHAYDLINKLLEPNPEKRLGARGSAEIKQHPFFEG